MRKEKTIPRSLADLPGVCVHYHPLATTGFSLYPRGTKAQRGPDSSSIHRHNVHPRWSGWGCLFLVGYCGDRHSCSIPDHTSESKSQRTAVCFPESFSMLTIFNLMFEGVGKTCLWRMTLISVCILRMTLGGLIYKTINYWHCKMVICKVGILNYLIMLQKVFTVFVFVLSEENIQFKKGKA